jgi:hypothetical protein
MRKLALALALSLACSAAVAGDLGAPQNGPVYKPSSVALVFAGIVAVALAPASFTVLGIAAVGTTFFGAAYVNENRT